MFGIEATKAAVLQANTAFYEAFSRGDLQAMGELWAKRAQVTCFHPTSPVLVGREAVLASWKQLLAQPGSFVLRGSRMVVNVLDQVAVVTCYEGGAEPFAHLGATNIFVWEEGAWRLIHHHAGPLGKAVSVPLELSPSRSN